jgi:peptidoglycan hydrolase-like protein with peptidoglycan-binding domain
LPATGRVNFDTLKALEGPGVHHKDELIRRGDQSRQVLEVERNLRKLGYDPGAVDGKYDKETAAAVVKLKHDEGIRRAHGGSMTGELQQRVRRDLRRLEHAPLHARVKDTKEHRRLDAATARAAAQGIGAASGARVVKNVQAHLRAAGYDPKHVNGRWDERTETALKAFQRKSGLQQSGVVDARTWSKLKQAQMEAKNATSPAQAIGEHSRAVLHSERVLKKLKLHPGRVDGVFDTATQRAVLKFQKKHRGLADTGRIDRKTLQAMERAARPKFNLKTVKGCAQFLLHSKNVSFWTGLSTGSDRKNLERLARGEKAFVPATGGHVTPKLSLMRALVDMAKRGHIMINALTGGIHSPNSNHYRGTAVDLDISTGNAGMIERIARRHGGLRNFERDHIHLDF